MLNARRQAEIKSAEIKSPEEELSSASREKIKEINTKANKAANKQLEVPEPASPTLNLLRRTSSMNST